MDKTLIRYVRFYQAGNFEDMYGIYQVLKQIEKALNPSLINQISNRLSSIQSIGEKVMKLRK